MRKGQPNLTLAVYSRYIIFLNIILGPPKFLFRHFFHFGPKWTSNSKLVSSNFLTILYTNDSTWSIIWGTEGWRVRSCGSWLQVSHTKRYILTEDYADSTHPFSKTFSVKNPHMMLCGALFHITNKAELLTEPEGLNFPTNHATNIIRRRPWISCNDLGLSHPPSHPLTTTWDF